MPKLKLNQYRKLIAMIVGLLALQFGTEYIPAPEALTEAIICLGTAFGVWYLPNEPQVS